MRSSSTSPLSSNTHSSTLVALAENRAKLTPRPSQVAPSGKGRPSRIREGWASGVGSGFFGLVMGAPAGVFDGAVYGPKGHAGDAIWQNSTYLWERSLPAKLLAIFRASSRASSAPTLVRAVFSTVHGSTG